MGAFSYCYNRPWGGSGISGSLSGRKKYGIKVIFGIEAYLINDCIPIIQYSRSYSFDDAYVVLDIETTGLDAVNNEIIEIGAIKIHNRKIIDSFNSFVAPVNSIPAHITKLTGITQDMVKDAPAIKTVLPEFFDFCGDAALAAHNASFDINFILQKLSLWAWLFINLLLIPWLCPEKCSRSLSGIN